MLGNKAAANVINKEIIPAIVKSDKDVLITTFISCDFFCPYAREINLETAEESPKSKKP